MKIIVDTLEINHAWQYMLLGYDDNSLEDRRRADQILVSIMNRGDKDENKVEQIFDNIELKYLRMFEKDRSEFSSGAIQAVQTLRNQLKLSSITDEV